MRKTAWRAAFFSLLIAGSSGVAQAQTADLVWEVENPFRFFRPTASFAIHEAAYNVLRGNPNNPPPPDIISRVERRLNDPDCANAATPDTCAATKRARYEQSRLGWASQTVNAVCYDNVSLPRRYPQTCERRYSWGSAREDYILPEAHTVKIRLSPARLGEVVSGQCAWSWKARAGGQTTSRTQPCKDWFTIARVPYSRDPLTSGVAVAVKLPDGRELADPNVFVEDVFVVGLGDSFASGESNPDRPIRFSASRQMVYDPALLREERTATRSLKPAEPAAPQYGLASAGGAYDPKVLPRRFLDDEAQGDFLRLSSPEFDAAFEKRNAQWLSADCHRSQYGYPFRVGIQLALENRHRAVTFVSLACTGSEVGEGLFLQKDAREGFRQKGGDKVPAQLDQLSDLICRGSKTQSGSYKLPLFKHGSTVVMEQTVSKSWCPPGSRKRPVDLVLLSIGGNDVGFGGLVTYTITENASDLAPIAGWIGSEIRFGPNVSRVYLGALDERFRALKDALRDGFGIEPNRVVHTAYEPLQYDETGALCGAQPTLGMDVHPKLKLGRERLAETAGFLRDLIGRLECINNGKRRNDCPAGLATGAGTGFHFVTEHQIKFAKRGICAREPARAAMDGVLMGMPRFSAMTDEYKPYSPDAELPYAHRWRLFRTPNDSFLIANTHREGISPFDILQPAYAALYSGAFHPSAEAHAIVADAVMPYARSVLSKGTITVVPTASR